ncbi:MAG: hypothetical protein ACLU5I_02825 [Alistipes finegoldii]
MKQYLADQRQGTHCRAAHEVAGSTRKLKRQSALAAPVCGSIKSPLFLAAAVSSVPSPDYSFKLNKSSQLVNAHDHKFSRCVSGNPR